MKRLLTKPYLPIIIAPLILFAPLILAKKALVWGTVSTQFIPWWDFAWETLLHGRLPLWNPWVGMGAPLLANYQSAIFYPPYWSLLLIYAIAGVKWMSWSISGVVVFHLIWSGLGTVKLLEELELGKLAQVVGGLAFSLSGYLIARASFLSINAAAAWLPWILLYSLRLIKGKKKAFWALSIVMAFQLLAGHAQTAWYSILLGGIWVSFLAVKNHLVKIKNKKAWHFIYKYILAGLLGAGLSAIQLIPTAEYLLQSQRSGEYGYVEAMTYSFWPWRFLTLLVPNLFGNPATGNYWGYGNFWEDAVYIGLLPILITVGIVIRSILGQSKSDRGKKENYQRGIIAFFSSIVFISFVLALGSNTFLFPFLYRHIPTFGTFQAPTRFSLWAEIALAVLAGMGIDQLTQVSGKRKYWIRLAAAGCVAVIGAALIGWKFLIDVKTTFFIPIGVAGIFGLGTALLILYQPDRDKILKFKIWNGLVIFLVAVDLIIAGWGLNPGVDIDFYEKDSPQNRETRTFITSDLEYDLKFRKYFRFETFSPEVPWKDMRQDLLPNLPMLQRMEMVNNFDPLVPVRYQTWMEEYNKLTGKDQHQMTDLMRIGEIVSESDGQVHKFYNQPVELNNEVKISNLIEISNDNQKILDQIIDQRIDFSNNVILSSSSAAVEADCQSKGDGEVWLNEKAPGYIKVNAELNENSWLFWSQSWYPGWIAIIDGKQRTEVERANYLFQAVCVPKGEHIVEIIYRPLAFYVGAGITLACLAFMVSAGLINKKKN